MSYILIADELEVSGVEKEFSYSWDILGDAFEDFYYVWNILDNANASFYYKWDILEWVSASFFYKWKKWIYLAFDNYYSWDLLEWAVMTSKLKYNMSIDKIKNRLFKRDRIG